MQEGRYTEQELLQNTPFSILVKTELQKTEDEIQEA